MKHNHTVGVSTINSSRMHAIDKVVTDHWGATITDLRISKVVLDASMRYKRPELGSRGITPFTIAFHHHVTGRRRLLSCQSWFYVERRDSKTGLETWIKQNAHGKINTIRGREGVRKRLSVKKRGRKVFVADARGKCVAVRQKVLREEKSNNMGVAFLPRTKKTPA